MTIWATCLSMEKFKKFSDMFANFPTLQKDLSLLDKPATNGEKCSLRVNTTFANAKQQKRPHLAAHQPGQVLLKFACWDRKIVGHLLMDHPDHPKALLSAYLNTADARQRRQ